MQAGTQSVQTGLSEVPEIRSTYTHKLKNANTDLIELIHIFGTEYHKIM